MTHISAAAAIQAALDERRLADLARLRIEAYDELLSRLRTPAAVPTLPTSEPAPPAPLP